MKKLRFLAWAVMAAAAISFSACSDDDTKDNGNGGGGTDPEPELSTECKLTEFKLILGDETELTGEIFDFEKVVEVTYTTDKAPQLTSAKAVVKISDKATISPDPNVAADYSKADAPVKFTVTAEDGKTTATYTIEIKEKVVKAVIKFDLMWEKKVADGIKIGEDDLIVEKNDNGDVTFAHKNTNIVGASGDKIVLSNHTVYDRTGQLAGTLNTDGMGSDKILSMTNDFNGILIASVNNPNTTITDGTNKKVNEIWIWRNGWNAAPELLLNSTSDITKFICASGDMNGECLLTAKGAAHQTVGPHFCWYTNGSGWANKGFMEIQTKINNMDGSWAQMVSAASASIDDYVFVYDCQIHTDPNPSAVYMMENAKAEPVLFKGPGAYIPDIYGADGWGNYTRGTVRAFTFKDRAYCLAGTTSWEHPYFTVINPKHPTYEPLFHYAPEKGAQICPGTAYVEDKANDCAYLYLATPTYSLCCVKVYLVYE